MAKPRPCVQCGVIFLPEFPRGAARTCSDECSHARRKAVLKAADKTFRTKHAKAIRAKSIERAKRNPEKKKARWNAWAASKRKTRNAKNREWYAANREAISARRRAKRVAEEHDGA